MHDWTNSNARQPTPMNTPPSPSADWIPRHLTHNVQESLLDTRVVLVNGPRQCGKTTLVRQLGGDMRYITLDDPNMAALAQQDPVGLIRQLDRAIIDEVQRAPQLMLALKMAVDEDQRPGRFLLTGSANVLALPQMADSLAGRMEVHTLLPLSQAELQRRPNDFLQRAQQQDWPITHADWAIPPRCWQSQHGGACTRGRLPGNAAPGHQRKAPVLGA